MNMYKKALSMISIMILAVVLPACGGKEDTSADSGNADSNKSANKNVKIEFFNQKAEIDKSLKPIINDFQTEHPNIKVELVSVPDARTVLNTRISGDDVPDIVSIFPNESDFKVFASEGYFMDLSNESFMSGVNQLFRDDTKVEGKDYSIPITLNTYGIFYNQDKFKELGLEIPKTWDELKTVAAKIKEKGLVPFATSFKEGWTTEHLTEAIYGNITDKPYDFFKDPSIHAKDDASIVKLADMMDFFRENSDPKAIGNDYQSAVNVFVKGDALMFPQGTWGAVVIDQGKPSFSYSMFPIPSDEPNQNKVVYGIDYALAASAKTKNPEEVKTFLSYLASKEISQKIVDVTKSPSAMVDSVSNVPQTEEVTKLLQLPDRAYQWVTFTWEPGKGQAWQALTSEYLFNHNRDTLFSTIDQEFNKK